MTTLSHQYADLGQAFSQPSQPESVPDAKTLLWNTTLAESLGLDLNTDELPDYFVGQSLLPGSKPVAMAYSGHQFGQFNPHLGDGRAHLLGELTDTQGQIQELQLKGSGRTPYSRNGDGKCAIQPAVREFLMSEAMHALGVPTTRTLAVVSTGESIIRQTAVPGAVVTRVASSHIRIGSFEYFAARNMLAEVKTLADLVMQRHYPEVDTKDNEKYFKLLSYVIDKQIGLVVSWMRVGFIHGVMNTDNCLLSGDIIDYGPCAMMGTYDPQTVFSSIDHQGRYAFGNQPWIMQWNLARLAECWLPLIDEDQSQAIAKITPLIEGYANQFNQAYQTMMSAKLGMTEGSAGNQDLVQNLLDLMFKEQLDYTQTFVNLAELLENRSEQSTTQLSSSMKSWVKQWFNRLGQLNIEPKSAQQVMRQHNPLLIPRNHHVEQVLQMTEQSMQADAVEHFLVALRQPYAMTDHTSQYLDSDPDADLNYQTFCGT